MELDERKRTILTAIIQTYLETGEPVGSRTISKYTDLNLSSATIRNEMSDLEEMGYILQPHTSAGRIPSDKGYRLYVNELIREKDQEADDMKEMMIEKTDRLEKITTDQLVPGVGGNIDQIFRMVAEPEIILYDLRHKIFDRFSVIFGMAEKHQVILVFDCFLVQLLTGRPFDPVVAVHEP